MDSIPHPWINQSPIVPLLRIFEDWVLPLLLVAVNLLHPLKENRIYFPRHFRYGKNYF
uniref:Uncharacterized protein n=1 Tax=Octopus bimaculoides TaxID=37653 RepID=A0A0L8HLQ7_OCTBM